MGFWDWATTGREGIQSGIGAVVHHPVQAAVGAVAPPIEAAYQGAQHFTAPSPKDSLEWFLSPLLKSMSQGSSKPADPAASGGGTGGGAGGGTPTTTSLGWNPLAVNMFYNQAVAPMLNNLNSQFQDWNQQYLSMAQNVPGQQYLTPSERAMTQLMPAHMALENNLVAQAGEQAAQVAPTIDAMQGQMGNIESALRTAYAEAIKQNEATTAGLYTGQSTPGTAAPTTGGTTSAAPSAATSASQEIQNALTQANTANLPTAPPSTSTSNVGAGKVVSGAGLSDAQKQALEALGFTVGP